MPKRMRLQPAIAGSLEDLPFESNNGALSFLTRNPTCGILNPRISTSISKYFDSGTCPSSTPFRLNSWCAFTLSPAIGVIDEASCDLKNDSFINETIEPKSNKDLNSVPFAFRLTSGHGAIACSIISNFETFDIEQLLTCSSRILMSFSV